MKKRFLSMFLVLCMVFTLLPSTVFATEGNVGSIGDAAIGSSSITDSGAPAVCENHKEHDESCGYVEAVAGHPCSHLNEDGTYSCFIAEENDPPVSENEATPSDAKEAYVCDHTDGCGYIEAVEGAPCAHECELCMTKPTIPDSGKGDLQEQCSCTVLCTEDKNNHDCPVCAADGADLDAVCYGEKVPEDEKALERV